MSTTPNPAALNIDERVNQLEQQIAETRNAVQTQSKQLAEVLKLMRQASSRGFEATPIDRADGPVPEQIAAFVSRRSMLKKAALATLGAATVLETMPSARAGGSNGQDLVLGETNTSSATTQVTASSGDGLKAISSTSYSGVYGVSDSGAGAKGLSNSSYGLKGSSDSGVGCRATSASASGVYGSSQTGIGVKGTSSSTSGVYGLCNSTSASTNYTGGVVGNALKGSGVVGKSNGGNGTFPGVFGVSGTGSGVFGQSASGYGVQANSTYFIAIYAQASSNSAIYATSSSQEPTVVVVSQGQGFGLTVEATDPNAYGAYLKGGLAPLWLAKGALADPNTSTNNSIHNAGELYVDSGGGLWYCIEGGTPGAWRQVARSTTAGSFSLLATPTRFIDTRPASPSYTSDAAALTPGQVVPFTFSGAGALTPYSSGGTPPTIPFGATGLVGRITVLSGESGSSVGGQLKVSNVTPPGFGSGLVIWKTAPATQIVPFVLALNTTDFTGSGVLYFQNTSTADTIDLIVDVTGYYY